MCCCISQGSVSGTVQIDYTWGGQSSTLTFPLCTDFGNPTKVADCMVSGMSSTSVANAFNMGLPGRRLLDLVEEPEPAAAQTRLDA